MKKEEIYVRITSEEARLRVISILEKAGETICKTSNLLDKFMLGTALPIGFKEKSGWQVRYMTYGAQITVDELEALLLPSYVVKDVVLSLDELKSQAEKLGYNLIEKPYEPKVGDFGAFWDDGDEDNRFGFLTEIDNGDLPFKKDGFSSWENFRKLTKEEKQKIQVSW